MENLSESDTESETGSDEESESKKGFLNDTWINLGFIFNINPTKNSDKSIQSSVSTGASTNTSSDASTGLSQTSVDDTYKINLSDVIYQNSDNDWTLREAIMFR